MTPRALANAMKQQGRSGAVDPRARLMIGQVAPTSAPALAPAR